MSTAAARPLLLDLFCCQGGAAKGYTDAGFEVDGVDNEPQPRYPYRFIRCDAFEYLAEHGHKYQAIHMSPPCPGYSLTERINDSAERYPRWVNALRFMTAGMNLTVPWVIENVPGAPLRSPIELCGAMFGLRTYRHRLFESNRPLVAPPHPVHDTATTKMGRPPQAGEFMHVVGNFSGAEHARTVMEMPWASRDGLREAIPPAYTAWVGAQLLAHIQEAAA